MFNVELSVADHGGHAVVALCGELDLADAPAVASQLMRAAAVCRPIIVDLTGLTFIDCCGLGILERVRQWTRDRGGDLSLAAPQHRVREVLRVTGLTDVFSIYPSVDQAVAGLGLAPLAGATR